MRNSKNPDVSAETADAALESDNFLERAIAAAINSKSAIAGTFGGTRKELVAEYHAGHPLAIPDNEDIPETDEEIEQLLVTYWQELHESLSAYLRNSYEVLRKHYPCGATGARVNPDAEKELREVYSDYDNSDPARWWKRFLLLEFTSPTLVDFFDRPQVDAAAARQVAAVVYAAGFSSGLRSALIGELFSNAVEINFDDYSYDDDDAEDSGNVIADID